MRLTKEHEEKVKLRKTRRTLQRKRVLVASQLDAEQTDDDDIGRGPIPKHGAPTAASLIARPWFQPVFDMVPKTSRWPISESHLQQIYESFVHPDEGLKGRVIGWLRSNGRTRAGNTLHKVWNARRACLAFISSKLGVSMTKDAVVPTFVEGVSLAKSNRPLLLQPCGGQHPGICAKLHAVEYKAAVCAAQTLQKMHKPADEDATRFLVFDCLASTGSRMTVVVWKIGGTGLASAPRSIFLTLCSAPDMDDAISASAEVESAEMGCKVPVLQRPAHMPLPARLALTFCERESPRLKLQEPVHCTQFSLALVLHKVHPPASAWQCLEAQTVRWQGKRVWLSELQNLHVWEAPVRAAPAATAAAQTLENVGDDDVLDADMIASLTARREALRRQARLPQQAAPPAPAQPDVVDGAQPWKKGSLWKDIVSDDSDVSSGGFSHTSDSSDCVREYVAKAAKGLAKKKAAANKMQEENKKRRRDEPPAGPGRPAAPPPAPSAPGPGAPAAPPEQLPPAGPAAAPAPAVPAPLPGNFAFRPGYSYVQILHHGWICFSDKNINGHCHFHHQQGIKCHCDRLRAGYSAGGAGEGGGKRPGQGRPLGLLMLWLTKAQVSPNHSSRECKLELGSAAYHAERFAARQALKNLPGTTPLFTAERPLREGEPEEPLVVPG